MSKLELFLLGRFECLRSSDSRITLSMRKAEVLLAYLALTPGLRHPRERLINLLWSDRSDEQSRNSLRQCLSAIKKSLGEIADLVLLVDRTTVCLVPELIEVDVLEFERLATLGDYESLTTAADLYQGEFLEGISIRDAVSQEWLDNERARFRRQFVEILSNLAETQLVSHDFGNAIKSAERLVKQDPLGEAGWRLLMRSYFKHGDRSHALQAFKRCNQVLLDELDVAPEAETVELRDQIAGGASKSAPAASVVIEKSPIDPAPATAHSIAVLPFENMSGDPEQEHFSDGITTDIIATLCTFRHMRTISRYSTMQYKQEKPSIAEIAAQQGVRYLLEGSVRKNGGRIRVNAELIDSNDEQILWNERYDRDLDDLFAVQDEITKNIALAMKVQFDDGEMALHRSKGTSNTRAWELTLAATDLQDTYIRQNILEARAMTEQAIILDPDYAFAWIALGWTYWQEAYSGWGESIDDLVLQAEKVCSRAFELDPDYSEAWGLSGLIQLMKHEPEAAIEACRRGVELEPGNAEAQALTAFAYVFNSDYDQGQRHNQNMLKLCPIRANWYYMIGAQIEKIAGNLEKAAELYQRGIEVEPDSPLCRFYLIDVLLEKGDPAGAGRLADEIRALDSSVTGKGLVHSYAYDKALRDRFQANLEKFNLY